MKFFRATALAALAMAGAAMTAAAAPTVQWSAGAYGGVYHVAVCPGPAAPGMALCHAHVVTDVHGITLSRPAGSVAAASLPAGYGPADLTNAYKIPASASTLPTDATGAPIGGTWTATIAVVDAFGYPNAESDLNIYRAAYGLGACTTANGCFRKVNQTGGTTSYPKTNDNWDVEQALDIEMASAICPNCKIMLVEANYGSFKNLGAAVNTAAVLGATVISNSYGGMETGTLAYQPDYDHPGVAITVSSGDNGYMVQFPASSPTVTAVGGTVLFPTGDSPPARGWGETVWPGAGSGCSAVYAKPVWQTDPGCTKRMVADVSAVADPNTGVAVYAPLSSRQSGWQIFGGTSVAAPIVASVYAVNAATIGASVNYGENPYLNPGALFDVTNGSNGVCPTRTAYFCRGKVGYDGPSGLGTPNGAAAF